MNYSKFLIAIVATFITAILGLVIFLITFTAFGIYNKYSNPHPEHPTMPISELVFTTALAIPISIFFFIKIFKWLIKRNE